MKLYIKFTTFIKNQIKNAICLPKRRSYALRVLNLNKKVLKPSKLTRDQKNEIKQYYRQFGIKYINTDFIACYSKLNEKFDVKYIPDDLYFRKIDMFYTSPISCRFIDNKSLYDLLFPEIKMPRTICRKMFGAFQDRNYNLISEEKAIDLCLESQTELIIKPALISGAGLGIKFWENRDGIDSLRKIFKTSKDLIIQEVIKQHPVLNKLHKNSINTIRLISLTKGEQVIILSGVLRIGANGSRVDNFNAGGMGVGIYPNGKLKDYAITRNVEKIYQHPQGTKFSELIIPNYEKCKILVKKMAPRLIAFSRLISWDFAIGEDGEPIFIESNLTFGGVDIHQFCNGPIFGDLTNEILQDVFIK